MESALESQLLGGNNAVFCRGPPVQADEVVHAEIVDIGVEGEPTLGEVLAIGEEGGELKYGAPLLEGASVAAKIVDQFRGKKVVAFHMHRRKGYRRTKGHRQSLTRVEITGIQG